MSNLPENEEIQCKADEQDNQEFTIEDYFRSFINDFNNIKDLEKTFNYLKYEEMRLKNDLLKLEYLEKSIKLNEPTLEDLNNYNAEE